MLYKLSRYMYLLKKIVLHKTMIKLSVLSLLLVFFVVMLGGSMNPPIWKQQLERKLNPTVLLDPNSSAIKNLNDGFEESYDFLLKLKREDIVFLDEIIIEISNIYVQSQISYRSDTSNYHSIDHLATTSEILKRGADDCDGQAILIASLLRYRGYDAYVVFGYSHVWVEVHFNNRVISINNPKQCDVWYCKFNEQHVQWNILPFFALFMGFFLLFLSLLSMLYYFYKKNVVKYISDYLYFFKYVLILFVAFLGLGILVYIIIKIVIP